MNILTPILFTLLVLCTSVWTPAYALDANVLELEEARLRALASNPGLAEMQERYEALTHLAPQVSSLPDPVVSLNAMNFPWNSFDVNQEPMTQVQLGVSQMFPFPGKLGLREDVALFEAEAALNSVEEMRLNLDMNVTVTWWEIYFLDRSLETVLRNQALFRQFVKIAQTKYEVGNGLQQDVLLAQLELSKLLNNEIQLKSMRERRLIRLNVLMDVSPDTLAALPVDMPAFSGVIAKEPILHQRALETRPLLKQEQASIEASKSRLALAEKDFYPDFKVGVSYGNREEDDFGRSRKDFLSVMLSVNVPLYAGTKQSEAVKQRSREFAKSKYALIDKRNLVLSSISNSLTEYDQAAEQLYLFGEGILPQARQTVESMLVGYQVNEVDFLNLVRSQVTLLNYELQYWKAFTEINQSVARLAAPSARRTFMNKVTLLGCALSLAIGLGVGYYLIPKDSPAMSGNASVEKKPMFYRSPMNPQVTSPVPATDPMGMDYVPVYADDGESEVAGTVKINPVVQNNIGLRTDIATREVLSRTIRTVGRVDYDEEKMFRLHPKVDGWIKDIRVDKTGQPVQADEVLLEIYSPKLVSTQQEFLLALQNYELLKDNRIEDIRRGAIALVSSSRDRLSLLDVPEHQIKALEKSGTVTETLHIHSPVAGTVLHIGARQGQYVTPGSELYQIADLSTVWVYADIYEYELPWVNEGDPVEMTLTSLPGRVLTGTVSYIFPYAESKTRTTKVRVIFENPEMLLRPEMFADITIRSQKTATVVVVPAEAIIRSGEYSQIFVMKEEGVFEPRKVELGVESGGKVAVLEGIRAGEEVVVSAQFLIDSESSLREATAKMTQMEPPVSSEHDQDHTSESPADDHKPNSEEGTDTGHEHGGDH